MTMKSAYEIYVSKNEDDGRHIIFVIDEYSTPNFGVAYLYLKERFPEEQGFDVSILKLSNTLCTPNEVLEIIEHYAMKSDDGPVEYTAREVFEMLTAEQLKLIMLPNFTIDMLAPELEDDVDLEALEAGIKQLIKLRKRQ